MLKQRILHLYDSRIIHFFLVGGIASCLHIFCAWFFTAFVFGLPRYYVGYFIGMGISWIFNFLMHFHLTFRAKDHFGARLAGFLTHSIVTNLVQAWTVTTLTSLVGKKYYLIVITGTILAISIATFFVYKLLLFATFKKKGT